MLFSYTDTISITWVQFPLVKFPRYQDLRMLHTTIKMILQNRIRFGQFIWRKRCLYFDQKLQNASDPDAFELND